MQTLRVYDLRPLPTPMCCRVWLDRSLLVGALWRCLRGRALTHHFIGVRAPSSARRALRGLGGAVEGGWGGMGASGQSRHQVESEVRRQPASSKKWLQDAGVHLGGDSPTTHITRTRSRNCASSHQSCRFGGGVGSYAQSDPISGLPVLGFLMPGPRFELGTRRFSIACSTN